MENKIKRLQEAEQVLRLAGAKLERIDRTIVSPLLAGLGGDDLLHRLYLLFEEFKPIEAPSKALFYALQDKSSSIFAGADTILEALGEEPFYYKEFGKLILNGAELGAIKSPLFAELMLQTIKEQDYVRAEGDFAELGGKVFGHAVLTVVKSQYGSLDKEVAKEKVEEKVLSLLGEDLTNKEFLAGVLEAFRERNFKLSSNSRLAETVVEFSMFLRKDKEVANIVFVASPYINSHFTPKDLKSFMEMLSNKEVAGKTFTESFKTLIEEINKKDLSLTVRNFLHDKGIDSREEISRVLEKQRVEEKVNDLRLGRGR